LLTGAAIFKSLTAHSHGKFEYIDPRRSRVEPSVRAWQTDGHVPRAQLPSKASTVQ
jgi:hypothetical protein